MWSAQFRGGRGRGTARHRPRLFQPPCFCFAVGSASRLWNRSSMPIGAGERVRLVRDAAAPQGWHPTNFLSAMARTALCVVYVEDDDWVLVQCLYTSPTWRGRANSSWRSPSFWSCWTRTWLAWLTARTRYALRLRLCLLPLRRGAKVHLGATTTQRSDAVDNVHVRVRRAERST